MNNLIKYVNQIFSPLLWTLCSFFTILMICFSLISCKQYILKADETDQVTINSAYSFNNVISTALWQDNYFEVSMQSYFTYTTNLDINYGPRDYSSNTITAIQIRNDDILFYWCMYDEFGQRIVIDNNDVPLQVYTSTDGWLNDEYRFVFMSMTLDDESDLYYFIVDNGVFAYTYQVPQSSMGDLIYTYIDIIPRTMQNLTSFEILGFSLFALIGVFIIVLLIIKVVRRF